jgi:hypothetical protein
MYAATKPRKIGGGVDVKKGKTKWKERKRR